MIHIYCGNGKGKTTAAIGLAVRAAGRGKKVLIARFLKTDDSGEVPVLSQIPGISVLPCEKTFGFFFRMTDEQKKEAGIYYRELLEKAFLKAGEGAFDLLILDEIMAAVNCGLADEERLIWHIGRFCLPKRSESQEKGTDGPELVLTGRDPSPRLLELADYVTEMKALRHPYEKGIAAREGIEY